MPIGINPPTPRIVSLSGTSAATVSTDVLIPHGQTLSKIVGMDIFSESDIGRMPPGFSADTSYVFYAYLDGTNVVVSTGAAAQTGKALAVPIVIRLRVE